MFEKTDVQKAIDILAETIINNTSFINTLAEPPYDIDIYENEDGKRYIALGDVRKLLDNKFIQHRYNVEAFKGE